MCTCKTCMRSQCQPLTEHEEHEAEDDATGQHVILANNILQVLHRRQLLRQHNSLTRHIRNNRYDREYKQ